MESLIFFTSTFGNVLLFILLYFEVFLLFTYLENYRKIKQERTLGTVSLSYYPTVTVMVPCFNEEKTVEKTIQSLFAINYPKDRYSICIIDDGSTDRTWEKMQQFKHHDQVTLLKKENGGKHTALNLGLAHTTSELVGCLDADSFVHPEALNRIVKRFNENPNVMAVTPCIHVHEPSNFLQHIQKAMYTMGTFIRKTFALLGSQYITPGPFSFFRREVFAIVGQYKEAHHTEDLELAMRLQIHGLAIENVYDAEVYTVTPNTIPKLFRQQRRWAYGFIQNAIDYRDEFFFKRKYGNLGLIVLPMAALSVLAVVYFLTIEAMVLLKQGFDMFDKYQAVGLPSFIPSFSFSLFYINTEVTSLLGIISIATLLFMTLAGKWMMEKRIRVSKDIVYFIFCYSFLAPWWIISALWNTVTSRKPSWR